MAIFRGFLALKILLVCLFSLGSVQGIETIKACSLSLCVVNLSFPLRTLIKLLTTLNPKPELFVVKLLLTVFFLKKSKKFFLSKGGSPLTINSKRASSLLYSTENSTLPYWVVRELMLLSKCTIRLCIFSMSPTNSLGILGSTKTLKKSSSWAKTLA